MDTRIDIGIGEAERREITEGLSRLLGDTYLLYIRTHGYHWNVTGPQFNTLHLMFEAQYSEMIRRLLQAQEAVVRTARCVFPVVERAGDEASADLLTQRLQIHEKTAWMLRSMLEAP